MQCCFSLGLYVSFSFLDITPAAWTTCHDRFLKFIQGEGVILHLGVHILNANYFPHFIHPNSPLGT